MNFALLKQMIVDSFNLEELHTLCFDLEINFDTLPGQGLEAKARDLVSLMDRSNRLDELMLVLKEKRPAVDWEQVIENPAPATASIDTSLVKSKSIPPFVYIGVVVALIAIALFYFIYQGIDNAGKAIDDSVVAMTPIITAVSPQIEESPTAAHAIEDSPTAIEESPTAMALPTHTPTSTATASPTNTPTPDPYAIVQNGLIHNCISTAAWTPYRGLAMPTEEDCWLLDDWGIFAENQGLRLLYGETNVPISHGMYTSVPAKGKVAIDFQIDTLASKFDIEPALVLGFTSAQNPSPSEGLFFLLKIQTSGQQYAYLKIFDGENEDFLRHANGTRVEYPFKINSDIDFFLDGHTVTVFAEGEQIGNPLIYQTDDTVLWLGYQLNSTTEIDTFISSIIIEESK
jgi:hypothetical protein